MILIAEEIPQPKVKKHTKTTFTYGDIPLDIIYSQDSLVPDSAIAVKLDKNDKNALAIAIRENYPTLLIGEAGTGKTSAVKELAYLRQQPYTRVNMTGFTTPDELIGTKSVKNGATYFEHGIITNAMSRGAILVLDEINATSPDCLFILHGLLDEDKRITLPNGEVITPHKDFRVFATCNPDYEGTKSMNKAFLDRFPIVIEVDVLAPKAEIDLLVKRTAIDEKMATDLVTIATMARNDYAEQKILTYVSTRGLLNVASLIQNGLTARNAYESTIVKKTSNKEEKKILTDFFLSVMKLAEGTNELDTPIVTTKRELEDLRNATHNAQAQAQDAYNIQKKTAEEHELLKNDYTALKNDREAVATLSLKRETELVEAKKQLEAYKSLERIIKEASIKLPEPITENDIEDKVEDKNPF